MLQKFLKYGIGGGFAAILDLALLRFFTEFFGIFYIVSAILAFCISLGFSYIFHKYITFDSKETKHSSDLSKFFLFQVLGLGINILLLWIFVNYFGIDYFIMAFINKIIVFFWNFCMNYYFNFSKAGKSSQS